MNSKRDNTTLELLSELTRQSISVIISELRARQITYIPEPVPYSTIEGFSYDERGPAYTGSSHGTFTKKNWGKAVIDIGRFVFKLPAISEAENFIKENYDYPYGKTLLEQYAFQQFHLILERGNAIVLTAMSHQPKCCSLSTSINIVECLVFLSRCISKREIIVS